ncbi:phosphoribosylanthranilate isomerase [Methylacidiphilum sp. Yel]|uniref:phosphoribosylanthranilate isomerase n=1 Tax=Methylacidiphilum sp. Yel TaxID=1847730 RepID=UPI00106CD51E|nr:phosphoribosylanthranilate isomerase [Methylacidiphilum sp. Yel]TFE69655.1 phosphoribosylanthranilate isomerase [Methylacidiphilum sp. Yel]
MSLSFFADCSKVWVKICGITSIEDALMAVELGADALGFVFYPKSPRYLTVASAAKVMLRLPPRIVKVAVVVNPSQEQIEALEKELPIDLWQLHGEEDSKADCWQCRNIIKALSPPFERKMDPWKEIVHAFLLDSKSEQWGGSGIPFDWKEIAGLRRHSQKPFILAGGLNPENIQKALLEVEPFGVDVSSGVESYPGKKDKKKLLEFIEKCKKERLFR